MNDRNAPCPCGSGKKYKKCCGGASLASNQDPVSINREIAYLGDIGRRREAFCRSYIAAKKEVIRGIEVSLSRDAANLKETITCSKGCGECCSQYYVAASLQECEAIVYWLYQHRDVLLHFLRGFKVWQEGASSVLGPFQTINKLYGKKILGQVSEEEERLFRQAMDVYERRHISCPFLKEGACSVYEVRPYVCAGVVSVSPPAWCLVSHADHNRMRYLKNEMRFEQDMPYFVKMRTPVFFGSMPLLVNNILTEGYATLSVVPGLEGLQQAAFSDPELLSALRKLRL
jgi:Fe-S-cluster containining protein